MSNEIAGKRDIGKLLLEEAKEVFSVALYLFLSLSILETYKSLILLQRGVDQFGHNYTVAIVEALALSKIVALAQHLPFLKALNQRALALAVLYQSILMTLIVDAGGAIEDHFFPAAAKLVAESANPLALMITHQLVSMLIFIVLFSYKGLEAALGEKTLYRLFFSRSDKSGATTQAVDGAELN